jgi:hypothetical protein
MVEYLLLAFQKLFLVLDTICKYLVNLKFEILCSFYEVLKCMTNTAMLLDIFFFFPRDEVCSHMLLFSYMLDCIVL